MPIAKLPPFVLVMSTNPHREGQYGRAGLRFTRAWRVLQVDNVDDRDVPSRNPNLPEVNNAPLRAQRGEAGLVSAYTVAVFDADPFLAVKPATEEQAKAALEAQATSSDDKDAKNAELVAKNADLEARLMRLEVAASSAADIAKMQEQIDALRAKSDASDKARAKAEKDLQAKLDSEKAQAKDDVKK